MAKLYQWPPAQRAPIDMGDTPQFGITNAPAPATPPTPATTTNTASNKLWLRTWNLSVGKAPPAGQQVVDIGPSAESIAKDPTEADLAQEAKTQGGRAVDLSDFHFTFDVRQSFKQFPWTLEAKIYNVPPGIAQLLVEQYSDVSLTAGYRLPQPKQEIPSAEAQPSREEIAKMPAATSLPLGYKPGGSLLFTGQVIWYERGRDNETDTYLIIHAAMFDAEINQSVVSTMIDAGHSQKDIAQACADAMAKESPATGTKVTLGQVTPDLDGAKSPRSRTLYGQPRDVARDLAQSVGAYCHIDDGGKLNIMKPGELRQNSPIFTINTQTGMIGIPTQKMDGGISAKTLLNPAIKPAVRVRINQKDINQKTLSSPYTTGVGAPGAGTGAMATAEQIKSIQFQQFALQQATDGDYWVWEVHHYGDSRGNPWYTEITTMPMDMSNQAAKFG